uniref:Interferon regulatory factor-3 domain-containing protein n=1 Tax=Ursus americanus TaxID=9643 RepID=A0A452S130_URSAM
SFYRNWALQLQPGEVPGVQRPGWAARAPTRRRVREGLGSYLAGERDRGRTRSAFAGLGRTAGGGLPARARRLSPTWAQTRRACALTRRPGRAISGSWRPARRIHEFVISGAGVFTEQDSSPDNKGREELLSDMVLAPFPGGGSSSFAVAPEHPSQLLLSPYLGISAICWKSEPTENPLRRPLGPEEDLMVFVEGSGHSPSYTLCFLVGQSWPQDQLWIKGLVRLKVVPTQLRALLDTALLGDASLLESTVDLHVSSSHPLSLPSTKFLSNLVEERIKLCLVDYCLLLKMKRKKPK